jgi:hypothetical protein
MRNPVLLLGLVAGSACASSLLTQRAASDLGCQESSVTLQYGWAGAVRATGCGDWIDYSCIENRFGPFCTEERRGHDLPATRRGPRTPRTGAELGACFGNETCFAPLVCVQDICLRPGGAGQIAGPCLVGRCNSPLACVRDRCEPAAGAPPPPVGSRSGACYPNETCNAGLRCVNNLCGDEPPQEP